MVVVSSHEDLGVQSCPTLCNPIDGSPPGSPVPGILQARTLEWVAILLGKDLVFSINDLFIYLFLVERDVCFEVFFLNLLL